MHEQSFSRSRKPSDSERGAAKELRSSTLGDHRDICSLPIKAVSSTIQVRHWLIALGYWFEKLQLVLPGSGRHWSPELQETEPFNRWLNGLVCGSILGFDRSINNASRLTD